MARLGVLRARRLSREHQCEHDQPVTSATLTAPAPQPQLRRKRAKRKAK
jgi:hypothetical protein